MRVQTPRFLRRLDLGRFAPRVRAWCAGKGYFHSEEVSQVRFLPPGLPCRVWCSGNTPNVSFADLDLRPFTLTLNPVLPSMKGKRMSKFNVAGTRAVAHGPIRTDATATATTFEGAPGFAREAKSELFLLGVSNMVGENTFYENASQRDSRFSALVREVALTDFEWLTRFARWLRTDANMRTAPMVLAAEAAKARLDAGQPGSRAIVDAVLQRADEPGEMIGYWLSTYGRKIPKPIKRGVADAVKRLYNEHSLAKYDSAAHAVRFGDVLDLVHPTADKTWQGALYMHALDRRHGRDAEIPEELRTLRARAALLVLAVDQRRALFDDPERAREALKAAGMTWESVAGWLQGPMDAAVWEAVIPSMGFMACIRNLRNFDEAGVSDKVAATVAARLSDPEQVAKSRQLPMRFLSAYRAAPSLRWAYPLEQALDASLANIPALAGRTLILVDTSTSMNAGFSKDGTLMRWDAAALFGIALASRCADADLVSFSSTARYWGDPANANTKTFDRNRGESVLKALDRWKSGGWFLGGGTATAAALRKHVAGHDRVVILTDEQAQQDSGEVGSVIPKTVPLYTWNLAGYQHGHAGGGANRHVFGGLSDAGFNMIGLLERHRGADWPF